MASGGARSYLDRLSADVLSEIFRYTSMANIFLLFVACPPRLRALFANQSVKELHCNHECPLHIRCLLPRASNQAVRKLLWLPDTLASFRSLSVLHLVSNTNTLANAVLAVSPALFVQLPPTLRRIRLTQPAVLSLFFQKPPHHAPGFSKLPLEHLVEPIRWLNVSKLFPVLESLKLEERLFDAYLPHTISVTDGISFLKVLPTSVTELDGPMLVGFHAEALKALPPSLVHLTLPLAQYIASANQLPLQLRSEILPFVPQSLESLSLATDWMSTDLACLAGLTHVTDLTLSLPGIDTTLRFPPQLRHAKLILHRERSYGSLEHLPASLESLVLDGGYSSIRNFHADFFERLPRGLKLLDVAKVHLSGMRREDALFLPPTLHTLRWAGAFVEPLTLLPKTLTIYHTSSRWIQRTQQQQQPADIPAWNLLPPGLKSFASNVPLQITNATWNALPQLISLTLHAGSINEDDFVAIPPRVVHFSVREFISTGLHLPPHLRAVSTTDLKRSMITVKDARFGGNCRFELLTALEMLHCPPLVETLENVSIEHIPPAKLPRPLQQIIMPYHFDPDTQILDLPPTLTILNTTTRFRSSQLILLPPTLTTLKRATIIVDHTVEQLKAQVPASCAGVCFPGFVKTLALSFRPKLAFYGEWEVDIGNDHMALLPPAISTLQFAEHPTYSLTQEAFLELPTQLGSLNIIPPALFNLFAAYMRDLTVDRRLPTVKTAHFGVTGLNGALVLPSELEELALDGHVEISRASFPGTLTTLNLKNFVTTPQLLQYIPPWISTLSIRGTGPKMSDLDLYSLPRSLTNLSLSHVHLTKACLDGMPPLLTKLNIPKAMYPATTILRILADRRAAVAAASASHDDGQS